MMRVLATSFGKCLWTCRSPASRAVPPSSIVRMIARTSSRHSGEGERLDRVEQLATLEGVVLALDRNEDTVPAARRDSEESKRRRQSMSTVSYCSAAARAPGAAGTPVP